MELKKNPSSDLEKVKGIFLQIGLVLAIGLVLGAFGWSASEKTVDDLGAGSGEVIEEEQVQVTRQEEVKPPPPPEQPQTIEILMIVQDDVEIEDDFEFEDDEIDEETKIEMTVVDEEIEETIFFTADVMPQFPGGDIGLRKYIATHVSYPTIARENGIQGKVYIRFVVNSAGKVDKVQLARGVDPLLDKEALKVVRNLPKWKAGEQGGRKVSVWYTVPINFQLQ